MEGDSDVEVVLLRRAYALRNAGFAVAAAGAAIGLSISGDTRLLWLVGLLFTGGLLTLLGLEGKPRRIDAWLDARGVCVAGRVVARWRSFRAAWIERDGERTSVRVRARLVVRTREGKTFMRAMPVGMAKAALEAIQCSRASVGGAPEELRQRLRRGANEEDAAAWIARVRTLAAPASYRASGVAADALWQVVDDPRASAAERTAAAVALEVNATPDARQRLRDVAARIASPRVRVAIGHLAARQSVRAEGPRDTALEAVDGDDDPVTAAMASIGDQPRFWRMGPGLRRR